MWLEVLKQTSDVRAQVIGQFLARAESVFLQTNQGVNTPFFLQRGLLSS
jgi:hydrogenase maturation factor